MCLHICQFSIQNKTSCTISYTGTHTHTRAQQTFTYLAHFVFIHLTFFTVYLSLLASFKSFVRFLLLRQLFGICVCVCVCALCINRAHLNFLLRKTEISLQSQFVVCCLLLEQICNKTKTAYGC